VGAGGDANAALPAMWHDQPLPFRCNLADLYCLGESAHPTDVGLKHMQIGAVGLNFLPLARGTPATWRENFLYVYYWEKNFPQSPTVFALRNDRYKFITYYGLWDVDELYDLQSDPNEAINLRYEPEHQKLAATMENQLYAEMQRLGGMDIPLNQPAGGINNKRLRSRGGEKAADFPKPIIVDQPLNQNAR
jgi:N-acetylglucosamine-6-sulfatase